MSLVSFHNNPKIKQFYLARIKTHAEADAIIKGQYWENGKGCAVGCTIHSADHSAYEDELGIPEWLAQLEDSLFEGLPNVDAKAFPLAFLEAIPVGVNLDRVKWQFCAFLLKENIERVLTLDISDELKTQVVNAIRGVLHLHEHALESGQWDESAWSARSAAWSAESAWSAAWSAESAWSAARSAESAWSARSAAWSAWSAWSAESAESAWSAAWSAESTWSAESAWSAARSAAESAWSARSAWSAARSAAESAWSARSAAYKIYADHLLTLLRAAK